MDTTGVRYITDDELALWHSQIPNHKKAAQVMQVRFSMNWCEFHAQGDPGILANITFVRKGVLDLLQAWVGINARGRSDVVQITTGRQAVDKADLSNFSPGTNQSPVVVNVNPQAGANGNHKPSLMHKVARVGLK